MKRFYTEATVADEAGSTRVLLDDRPVRTPAKAIVALPTRALGEAVAAEWHAQGEAIEPATMALMRLSATAIDRVAPYREAVAAELTGFAGADVLCYRADSPDDLVARQARLWQPLLDWAADTLGAELAVTAGVLPIDQTDSAKTALANAIAKFDGFALAGVHAAAAAAGSLVIGLALAHQRIDADAAFAAGLLDEIYQAEKWGEDREAADRRRAIQSEIADAARFLELLRS